MMLKTIKITQAAALLWQRREVLADFEIELIEEVRARVRAHAEAVEAVTDAEWRVIDDATAAMRSAPTQALTAAGLAA